MSKRKCDGLAQLVSSYLDEEDSEQNRSSSEDEEEGQQRGREEKCLDENGLESAKKVKLSFDEAGNNKEETSLPLPAGILHMFNNKDSHGTASSSHDGRVRSFEHFPGNWALHVYAPFPAPRYLFPAIQSLVDSLPSAVAATMHVFPLSDLHISLSRTVPIRHYWIDPILEQLRDSLSIKQRFSCLIEKPHFYVNDEKTRSFLGLKVSTGEKQLQSFISHVDDVMAEFALPKFYDNPSYHISVAWCLGNIYTQITKNDEDRLQKVFDSEITEKFSSSLIFDVTEVRCINETDGRELAIKNIEKIRIQRPEEKTRNNKSDCSCRLRASRFLRALFRRSLPCKGCLRN